MVVKFIVVKLVAAIILGLLTAPLAAEAQQAGKVYRIGVLANVSGGAWAAFTQGLRDLGYVEGQNITIEFRSSEGKYELLPDLAAELVSLKVDVIVAPASQNVVAAKRATQTIPIVMAGSGDPVGAGLVSSLARPGGNVTGLSMLSFEIAGKQLALLKEVAPGVSRVAVLGNPANQVYPPALRDVKVAAESLGVRLQILEARGPDDLERAFRAMTKERAGAFLLVVDGMFLLHRARVVELAARHRLGGVWTQRACGCRRSHGLWAIHA
jgi:putative ABC transport system substrate-binding protein